MEPEADLRHVARDRLRRRERRIVQVPGDDRFARRQQHADVLREDLVALAHPVVGDRDALLAVGRTVVGVAVVDHLHAARVGRLELVGLNPARLVDPLDRNRRAPPLVLAVGLDVVGRRPDDQIGRTLQLRLELPRSSLGKAGHGRRVAPATRRARIHPPHDRLDLVVAQRDVVLVGLHADVLVDMPGRHEALLHAELDHARVALRRLVVEQRHRGERAGPMALHAMLPQDGRHVRGEGDLLPRRGRAGEHAANEEQPSEPDPPPGTINRPSRHDPPPSVPPPDVDKT